MSCPSRFSPVLLLDEMLATEVGAQIHNLPNPQTDEQHGCSDAEPLDAGVGAFVGVAQLLLTRTQVVHLCHDLGNGLFDATQLSFDGLQLLSGLNSGPVLGVGTNINVEFNVAVGVVRPWIALLAWCLLWLSIWTIGVPEATGKLRGVWGKANVLPDIWFSKQTSNAASACEVKTCRDSPTTSFARPYSFPTASLICKMEVALAFYCTQSTSFAIWHVSLRVCRRRNMNIHGDALEY